MRDVCTKMIWFCDQSPNTVGWHRVLARPDLRAALCQQSMATCCPLATSHRDSSASWRHCGAERAVGMGWSGRCCKSPRCSAALPVPWLF